MEPGIDVDAGVLSLDELRERAWAVVQPRYLDRLEKLIDAFAAAQARQNGSADLSDVARAAAEGRVATLLLEAGRSIPGRIDAGTGAFPTRNSMTRGSMMRSMTSASRSCAVAARS